MIREINNIPEQKRERKTTEPVEDEVSEQAELLVIAWTNSRYLQGVTRSQLYFYPEDSLDIPEGQRAVVTIQLEPYTEETQAKEMP